MLKISLLIWLFCFRADMLRACETGQPSPGQQGIPATQQARYAWRQSATSLALCRGDHTIWQVNFRKEPGKPYFHPLALADGTVLTGFRPPDHRWQRALWFSWKYINRVNYWEEDPITGVSEGQTEILAVAVTPRKNYSARIEMRLGYHPAGKPPVLTEERVIEVTRPDEKGCYRIDWRARFTAGQADVELDRTPPVGQPGGQSWGGYAGLTVRFASTIRDWQIQNSEGQTGKEGTNGKAARWYDISGVFRGDSDEDHPAGISVLDHPSSMRHPTPWQVNTNPTIFFVAYMPSFLFHEPSTILAGDKVSLYHRVLIHSGRLDRSFLEKEWNEFSTIVP
jgi:hypothetical protein